MPFIGSLTTLFANLVDNNALVDQNRTFPVNSLAPSKHWTQRRSSTIDLQTVVKNYLDESTIPSQEKSSLPFRLNLHQYEGAPNTIVDPILSPIAERRRQYIGSNRFTDKEKATFEPIRHLITQGNFSEAFSKLKALDRTFVSYVPDVYRTNVGIKTIITYYSRCFLFCKEKKSATGSVTVWQVFART
jgi:hypothetical protein